MRWNLMFSIEKKETIFAIDIDESAKKPFTFELKTNSKTYKTSKKLDDDGKNTLKMK